MRKICALLALALMLALIPAAALAAPQTTVKVQNVPPEVTGVVVLFANGTRGTCTKTGPNWNWSDGGVYVSDDVAGLLLKWSGGRQLELGRKSLDMVAEGGGTLVVRIKGKVCPPQMKYTVEYRYTGTVPDGAPALPAAESYTAGTTVAVAPPPSLAGYTFSGWTTQDVSVSDGEFGMPKKNVLFTGSFTALPPGSHTVRYAYTGTVPEEAPAVPAEAGYTTGATVQVAAAPVLEDYDFSGWSSQDVTITDGAFSMPGKDVLLTGSFSPKPRYTVTYQYTGTVPDGAPALPAAQSYKAGALVDIAPEPSLAGYSFTGWTMDIAPPALYAAGEETSGPAPGDGQFVMPARDVVISGFFTPLPPARYTVTYQYTGVVPPGAPALPAAQTYTASAEVTLAAPPSLAGYLFSGWTTQDATLADGKFIMPEKDVLLTGSFAELFTVTYAYTGAIPSGAPPVPPAESYVAGALVSVKGKPSLSGYTFTGWKTADAPISGGTFTMPEKDVLLTGSFSKNYTPPPIDKTPDTDASFLPPRLILPVRRGSR